MINSLQDVLATASKNLKNIIKLNPIIRSTTHFNERLILRFYDEDLTQLEKTIEKAFVKASLGKFKYTHPYYNITVVLNKMGLNSAELITCWKFEDKA